MSRTEVVLAIALAASTFTAIGCMPYAVPPITGDVGLRVDSAAGSRTGVRADLGISPMQVIERQYGRPWDATVAASFDRSSHNIWGVAAAAGPVISLGVDDQNDRTRLLPHVVGRWTTDGVAGGLRVGVEHVTFTNAADATPSSSYYSYGEAGIGLVVEGDVTRDSAAQHGWLVTVSVLVRGPALAGVACCISK